MAGQSPVMLRLGNRKRIDFIGDGNGLTAEGEAAMWFQMSMIVSMSRTFGSLGNSLTLPPDLTDSRTRFI
jgi:hypothetical protein